MVSVHFVGKPDIHDRNSPVACRNLATALNIVGAFESRHLSAMEGGRVSIVPSYLLHRC